MFRLTRSAPCYFEPRRQPSRSARIRTLSDGFGDRLLSQEHTPVNDQGVRGELNPPPRLSQSRMPNHYTTNTITGSPRLASRELIVPGGLEPPIFPTSRGRPAAERRDCAVPRPGLEPG